MQPLQTLAIIIGAVAFAFLVFVLIPKAVLGGLKQSLENRVKRLYPAEGQLIFIEYGATLFGSPSGGAVQWRGNGALALTERELAFLQLLPERLLIIPVSRITELAIAHERLGKATTSDLLSVTFIKKQGGTEAVTLWLPKPAELKARIESLPAHAAAPTRP